jgi:toxic protein SymE
MQNQKTNNQRRLKVYQSFRPTASQRFVSEPEIRLKGKWLKELGFVPGQSIAVKHENNCLTITLVPH